MGLGLFVDFGSTYTKVVAIELAKEEVAAVAQAASTVDTDIMIGLEDALGKLRSRFPYKDSDVELRLACSSAAGGLRMAAVGLVTDLTAEAAKRAALGAGAKVMGVFSYGLSQREVSELTKIRPDIILLAGGTDGGNKDVILRNAQLLAASSLRVPVVIAGNKEVSEEVMGILRHRNKLGVVVDNVMPELNQLNVEPARKAIREIFMRRIVKAKGFNKATKFIGNIIMPTPMAVLNAARLLADGTKEEPGLGELMLVDVGGATTDVHSVGSGTPSQPGLIPRGLPEPYAKRTVEGDLGLRINARSICDMAGKEKILANMCLKHTFEVDRAISYLSSNIGAVPSTEAEFSLDIALARIAVDTAVERHVGKVEVVYSPSGSLIMLSGKDLTQSKTLIGIGGVFSYGREPRRVLEAALFDPEHPLSLRPKAPSLYIDRSYLFYAMGLLGTVSADKSIRILKANLELL